MDAKSLEVPMRSSLIAILGMMAGLGVASAQQAPNVAAGSPVTVPPNVTVGPLLKSLDRNVLLLGADCPGQLTARQQASGGATVWTTAVEDQTDKDTANGKPKGLGVHIDFQGTKTAVKALELRVSYEPLGLKRVPVGPGTNDFVSNTVVREKNFNLDREAARRVDADLLVGPAATITRVHLVSATFANGTAWRAPSSDACSVVPSHFMLVNSK